MQLKDLIEKSMAELTDEELDNRLNILKRLKVMTDKPVKTTKITKKSSNKDKQVGDLVSKLTPEDITKLMTLLKEV